MGIYRVKLQKDQSSKNVLRDLAGKPTPSTMTWQKEWIYLLYHHTKRIVA